MQTRLEHVSLSDIVVSETNEMFRDPSEFTAQALQELTDSIKDKGVIQPVLLRPHPKGRHATDPSSPLYQLICGERRYHASIAAGLKTIPANIRELTDDESFECQVTENLQRKDVHPLKEAKAYKYLVDKYPKKNTPAELALRFGKNEKYVLHRLKLNDLVPEAVKDFASNRMTLGHALILARLTPQDQKDVIKRHSGRADGYDTVASMEWTINNSVIRNLSSAPFKKDDADLYPKAGSCTNCPKRSGANQLFADIKDKDRCFDQACFFTKLGKFTAQKVAEAVELKPDIHFLIDYHSKPDPEILKVLAAHKVKPLTSSDYSTYSSGNMKKIKGMWISGDKIGQEQSVYSTKQTEKAKGTKTADKTNGTATKAEIKETITGIQERMKRAAELDQEKIYVRVIEALQKAEPFTKVTKVKPTKTDEVMAIFMILEHDNYTLRDKIRKMFKLPNSFVAGKSWAGEYIKALERLTAEDKWTIMRMTMLEKFSGQAPNVHTPQGKLLMRAAGEYGGVDVDSLEREQKEIADKRESRAKTRIKDLKGSVKGKSDLKKKSKKLKGAEV